MESSVTNCEPQEPLQKRQKTSQKEPIGTHTYHDSADFDKFMLDLEHQPIYSQAPPLEDEIDQALKSFMNLAGKEPAPISMQMAGITNATSEDAKFTDLSSTASPINQSTFDSPNNLTNASVSSHEEEASKATNIIKNEPFPQAIQQPHAIASTVTAIKRSMADTSKFISTFTTLKTTYLKLCKEFNYLLSKFNDNERIKIELINENNELKSLLMEIIKERELERKRHRQGDLLGSRKRRVSVTA